MSPGSSSAAPPPAAASPATSLRCVALAGNPNCGKTTLFNALTGLRQRVGNYAGVTVERREGRVGGAPLRLFDLPGTYSLNARSPDEEIARDVLLGRHPPLPEAVAVVVDASNLSRNLYLALQIMDLGAPVVLCLNMMDVAESLGVEIDVHGLEQELGVPVIPMVASRGRGIQELREALQVHGEPVARRWRLPEPLESEAAELAELLASLELTPPRAEFFLALSLLAVGDQAAEAGLAPYVEHPQVRQAVAEARQRISSAGLDAEAAAIEARYDWIGGVIERTVRQGPPRVTFSDRLDSVATHRVWGFLLFFLVMGLMFQAIFTWAAAPMGWIELALGWTAEQASALAPEGDLRSLVVDGAIAGVGGVLIFIPQIMLLFFFIGLLEDSGYMARAEIGRAHV